MRNPVTTPASIIFGILLLGFIIILVSASLSITKEMYILESNKAAMIWGNAFLTFVDSFIALQCAGALIAYSLFLVIPIFHERRAFFRSFSSIVISIVIFTALYFICLEGISPLIKRNLKETRSLALFSESLYRTALQKKEQGDIINALEHMRLSLSVDSANPSKISEKSLLLSQLNDKDFQEYLALSTGRDPAEGIDIAVLLKRSQAALEKKDFTNAYSYAQQVLAVDSSNREALRISTIAGDQSYRESTRLENEASRYLYVRKKEGYDALQSGSGKDIIKAYFIFLDLRRKYPLDENVKGYLEEARALLPLVSFYIHEAELVFNFDTLAKKNIVFFNVMDRDQRELISIERVISVGGSTYLKNIEIVGFLRGNQILYHLAAPMGKIIKSYEKETKDKNADMNTVSADKDESGKNEKRVNYINLSGIDSINPNKRLQPQILSGTPPLDREKGIKLNVNPDQLAYFALALDDIRDLGTGELVSLLNILEHHAKMEELIILEIVQRVSKPFLLLILTFVCFCIGITQNARYLASPPKIIYVWVLIIPLVMMTLMQIFLFLHRMGVAFLYYVFGAILGILIIGAGHIFFLIVSLSWFGKKLGVSVRH